MRPIYTADEERYNSVNRSDSFFHSKSSRNASEVDLHSPSIPPPDNSSNLTLIGKIKSLNTANQKLLEQLQKVSGEYQKCQRKMKNIETQKQVEISVLRREIDHLHNKLSQPLSAGGESDTSSFLSDSNNLQSTLMRIKLDLQVKTEECNALHESISQIGDKMAAERQEKVELQKNLLSSKEEVEKEKFQLQTKISSLLSERVMHQGQISKLEEERIRLEEENASLSKQLQEVENKGKYSENERIRTLREGEEMASSMVGMKYHMVEQNRQSIFRSKVLTAICDNENPSSYTELSDYSLFVLANSQCLHSHIPDAMNSRFSPHQKKSTVDTAIPLHSRTSSEVSSLNEFCAGEISYAVIVLLPIASRKHIIIPASDLLSINLSSCGAKDHNTMGDVEKSSGENGHQIELRTRTHTIYWRLESSAKLYEELQTFLERLPSCNITFFDIRELNVPVEHKEEALGVFFFGDEESDSNSEDTQIGSGALLPNLASSFLNRFASGSRPVEHGVRKTEEASNRDHVGRSDSSTLGKEGGRERVPIMSEVKDQISQRVEKGQNRANTSESESENSSQDVAGKGHVGPSPFRNLYDYFSSATAQGHNVNLAPARTGEAGSVRSAFTQKTNETGSRLLGFAIRNLSAFARNMAGVENVESPPASEVNSSFLEMNSQHYQK